MLFYQISLGKDASLWSMKQFVRGQLKSLFDFRIGLLSVNPYLLQNVGIKSY